MRYLLEECSHQSEPASRKPLPKPCWELTQCGMLSCPAHANGAISCWRLIGTDCANHCKSPGSDKLEVCLTCPVFKLNAEGDPRGWNHFVASEIGFLTSPPEKGATTVRDKICIEVLDNLPHGVLITDEGDCIQYVNRAAERVTGLSANDLAGTNSESIFSGPPGEGKFTLRRKMWSPGGVCTSEFDVACGDGKTAFLKRTTSLFRNERGSVVAGLQLLEDVTCPKRLENDLQNSEIKYRRFFDGSQDMIFVHSKGGILMDANQATVATLGFGSKEELLAVASVERIYVNPIHRRVFQAQIDRFGFVKDFETSFQKQDGTRLHCLVNGNAVKDSDGRLTGYETFAKDVTARMDGVRNLHQQNRELSLLHSVAMAMNFTHDLDEILMIALRKTLEVLNLCSGAVFLINQEKSNFKLRVQQGIPERVVNGKYNVELNDQALMKSLLEEDRSLKPQRTFPPFKARLTAANNGEPLQLLCFLITAKNRASGFIALELADSRKITDRDHQMLGSLGNFLGSAIQNAYLGHTIRQHREELRRLTATLFCSQEEERKRIARELHDESGQALSGISFSLDRLLKNHYPEAGQIEEEILEVKKQINRTYGEIRRMSHRLHPALLTDLGLEPALESCLDRISKYSHIAIDFTMVGFEERMDPQTETLLYRISQEAITNTVKHSDAKHFRLSIIKSYPNIIFLAEDDGVGFDPDKERGQGLGLLGMRERASLVNGKFSLRTGEGKGTRIRVEIPIKESANE